LTDRLAKQPLDVLILGAGFAGLGMAIELKRRGILSFAILEQDDGVGGTWRENSYPGAGCDVPSHLYCFSFEPNPDWTLKFSQQPEILAYLEHCADKYGLRPHLRLGTAASEAEFDERRGVWGVRTADGQRFEARALVSGLGQLNVPRIPDLPGLADFGGEAFHSARWRHDLPMRGRRVAVVGTGASAIQFVPEIAPEVESLTVFQRSPNWYLQKDDRAHTALERWLFRHVPGYARLYRACLYVTLEKNFLGFRGDNVVKKLLRRMCQRHMRRQVSDDALLARLTPDYPVGCKRILITNDYLPALQRDNVELVTHPVARVDATGVIDSAGVHHDADTIIFGTGFESTAFLTPLVIRGLGGRLLNEAWADGAEAHLGIAVAGFPNFFMLYGPNTNLGHNSIVYMLESQIGCIGRCIEALLRHPYRYIDARADRQRDYNAQLQRELSESVWAAGCDSWYKTDTGRIVNNWPGFTFQYRRRVRRAGLDEFRCIGFG
jgi:cation diffusion facilitator CzcD-associated flavoprotein CzcO